MWMFEKDMLESFDLSSYDAARIAERTGVTLEQARAAIDPNRLYWICSSDYGFLAGADGEGRPCLVFVGQPRIASETENALDFVSYDRAKGSFLTSSVDMDLEAFSWDDVFELAEEVVGFKHVGRCPVRAFVYPGIWHYAVVPFAWHHHEFLLGDEEDPELAESLKKWIESECYVVQCGNSYFMNRDGEVESS